MLARLAPRRDRRRSRALLVVMSLGVLVLLIVGYWVYKNTGVSIRRTEVVTILSADAGRQSRFGKGSYRHHVRFPSGAEGDLTFGSLYRPGELVKVHYARNLRWGHTTVFLHALCDATCAAAYARPPESKGDHAGEQPLS